MSSRKWFRKNKIKILSLISAVLACGFTIWIIPNFRHLFGFDNSSTPLSSSVSLYDFTRLKQILLSNDDEAIVKLKNDDSAIRSLIHTLKDTDPDIRSRSAEALGKIKDARTVESLILRLDDTDPHVRGKAAEALGKIKDTRAIKPLIASLKDSDSNVRSMAAKALVDIKGTSVIDPLIVALVDSAHRKTEKANRQYHKEVPLISSAIDEMIDQLKDASIVFNAPETMRVKETSQILLLMSKGLTSEVLTSKLMANIADTNMIGKLYKDSVKVSTKMEAHLSGDGFTVRPITPIAQLVREKDETCWEWVVIAEEQGNRTLYLTLNAFIDYDGEKMTQTIQTYRKKIFVYVRPTDAVLAWIDRNIPWIAGLLGVILGAIIAHNLTLSHEKKKQEVADRLKQMQKTKLVLPNDPS
jgi:hypothetical protein